MDSTAKITLECDLIWSHQDQPENIEPTKGLKEINALYKVATSLWSLPAIRNIEANKIYTVYLWSLLLVVHRTTSSAFWSWSVVKRSKYSRGWKGFFPFITSVEKYLGIVSVGCHGKANVFVLSLLGKTWIKWMSSKKECPCLNCGNVFV